MKNRELYEEKSRLEQETCQQSKQQHCTVEQVKELKEEWDTALAIATQELKLHQELERKIIENEEVVEKKLKNVENEKNEMSNLIDQLREQISQASKEAIKSKIG